jgi:acetolactate synthase-1/2/3 large subunit
MAEVNVATTVAKVLKEEGVEWYAGIHGGHLWQLMIAMDRLGIKCYHVRHEQGGVYIADGWCRTTRKPGFAIGTAGPGFANMIPGIYQAYLDRSPVVCFFGQHSAAEDGWGPFQEGYAEPLSGHFTKWIKRIIDPTTTAYWIQKAIRDATTYPCGPVGIELPVNIQGQCAGDDESLLGYLPHGVCAAPSRPAGDPSLVEKAVRLLIQAEKPVILGGDGVFWSDASEELTEFVELLNIPVLTRRMGRGAVPEDHPLAFSAGVRRPIQMQSDVIAIFGLRMNTLEGYGTPPRFPTQNVKYIQVSEDPEELTTRLSTELSIFGSPKMVLRQMIDCAKEIIKTKPARKEWLAELAKIKEAGALKLKESVDQVRDHSPIHPEYLAAGVVEFLDRDATIILDSFNMANYTTDKITASFAGQVLDAATWSGVGHSVGIAMGAQLGRPGKQVLALLGDGGVGIAGWDIETTARYKIPACYLIFNNSSWIGEATQKKITNDAFKYCSWSMLPDIRYDKIFAEMGCHTELVTEAKHLKPALERCFNSGMTSVINVIPDLTIPSAGTSDRKAHYDKMFTKKG